MAIAAGTFKTVAVLMDVGESYAILGTGGKLGSTGPGTNWFSNANWTLLQDCGQTEF